MHLSRYDIAVAGDSLAARMAAALLAKHGKRVLLLATSMHRDPWQCSSLFTEQLISMLGGRDILADSQPFQVLTSHARVTVRRDTPLSSELTREFGKAAPTLTALFDELEQSGTHLEELLWESGGLPAGGLRNTLVWRWLCLRRKLPLSRLMLPLAGRLQVLPEPAGEWLRDLFQGLSLRPVTALSVAEAALLWAQARRSGGFSGTELNSLLHKRFEQFHGVGVSMDALSALEYSHGQWNGNLPEGKRFQAAQLIIGDLGRSLPGHGPLPSHRSSPPPRHFATSPLDGQISALLEKRVIVGGPLPVRMSLVPVAGGVAADIAGGPEADEAGVRCQLDPFLPFARYTLSPQTQTQQALAAIGTAAPSLFKLPIHLGSHLWCADETRLLPQLGSGGAALLAWTLARRIDPTIVAHGE